MRVFLSPLPIGFEEFRLGGVEPFGCGIVRPVVQPRLLLKGPFGCLALSYGPVVTFPTRLHERVIDGPKAT